MSTWRQDYEENPWQDEAGDYLSLLVILQKWLCNLGQSCLELPSSFCDDVSYTVCYSAKILKSRQNLNSKY